MRPGVGPPCIWIRILDHLATQREYHTGIRITRRFLHGDTGKDGWVNVVLATSRLEVLVVLSASTSGITVEAVGVDVDQAVEIQHRRIPSAVVVDSSVKPRFGARSYQPKGIIRDEAYLPIRASSSCD